MPRRPSASRPRPPADAYRSTFSFSPPSIRSPVSFAFAKLKTVASRPPGLSQYSAESASHLEQDDAVVVRTLREPGLDGAVPQLPLLRHVLDDDGVAGQRHPGAARADADVHLRGGGDVPDGVGVALGEEPQVAVELHLLQRHGPAGQPAVHRDRGEEAESLALEQFGHLARLVVGHGVPMPNRCSRPTPDVPGAQAGDEQVQAVLEGRRERPGEPLVHGGEHASACRPGPARAGRSAPRPPGRAAAGSSPAPPRPATRWRCRSRRRRSRTASAGPRPASCPAAATSSPSTRSMPAKLSGLGRLPASTRGRVPGGDEGVEHPLGVGPQPLPPRLALLRAVVGAPGAADELLGHQVHELALVLDVPVERGPRDAEHLGDPAEGDRLEAALGQQPERGVARPTRGTPGPARLCSRETRLTP